MNGDAILMKSIQRMQEDISILQRAPAPLVVVSSASVSSPPTAAQLNTMFGKTAAQAGRGAYGFVGTYFVYSDGTSWRWLQGTAAV